MKYYVPTKKYFNIKEFVPVAVYEDMGENAWILFDPRLLYTVEKLRIDIAQPFIINNWHSGGTRQYSGYRPCNCPIGAKYSAHMRGCAVDIIIPGMEADDVRQYIIRNQKKYEYITGMEKDVSWLHIDTANRKTDGIYLFSK